MRIRIRAVCAITAAAFMAAAWYFPAPTYGQANDIPRGRVNITAGSSAERRAWASRIDRMIRSGELRVRQTREDTLLPGRTHERSNQYYRGVRVFGGDVARQLRGGATESVFGTVYANVLKDQLPNARSCRSMAVATR